MFGSLGKKMPSRKQTSTVFCRHFFAVKKKVPSDLRPQPRRVRRYRAPWVFWWTFTIGFQRGHSIPVGGFQELFMFTPTWEKNINFEYYFFKWVGEKPPARIYVFILEGSNLLHFLSVMLFLSMICILWVVFK